MKKTSMQFFKIATLIINLIIVFVFLKVFIIKTIISIDRSPDHKYKLVISQIGEATWPHGDSTCSISLKKGIRTLSNATVRITTDGGKAYSSFFKTEWYDKCAIVKVDTLGNGEWLYKLYFNGDVIQEEYYPGMLYYIEGKNEWDEELSS